MLRRITTRDIARAAGIHCSTVSRALRNHPGIPEATRLRVRKIAEDLGYVPDPMLASLNAYRRAVRPVTYQATLAWVTNAETCEGWASSRTIHRYFQGAQNRAQAVGYKLDSFWLREPKLTRARAVQVLRARNIQGLLLSPQAECGTRLELDWTGFSVVSLGYTVTYPPVHMVSANHFRSAATIVRMLHERGYRRVGLALSATTDHQVDHAWIGGFLAEQRLLFPDAVVPPFIKDSSVENEPDFWAWYQEQRPDAIIAYDRTFAQYLRDRKVNIPEDVGLAFFHLGEDLGREAGIFEHPQEVGAAAVDLLIAMLNRNEKGIPDVPHRILIEGSWRDGPTILNRAKAPDREKSWD